MNKYYEGQTLQIDVILEVDITGATTKQIKYRKPSGSESALTATSLDDTRGWLTATLAAGNNNEDGVWTVWGYIVQSDGKIVIGQALEISMRPEGYK